MDELKNKLRFVEGILYHDWDPIGVSDCFQAVDEYDSYAPQIVTMSLEKDFSEDMVAKYLNQIRTVSMGLPENEASDRKVAKLLIDALGS